VSNLSKILIGLNFVSKTIENNKVSLVSLITFLWIFSLILRIVFCLVLFIREFELLKFFLNNFFSLKVFCVGFCLPKIFSRLVI